MITRYGPGDEATWPPYAGNPNDPRAPEPTDEELAEQDDAEPDDD